jgi:hypothetical protein
VSAADQVASLTEAGESVRIGAVAFVTTHWSIVLAAQGDSAAADEALEKICRTYWWPLYGFVRREGYFPPIQVCEVSTRTRFLRGHRKVEQLEKQVQALTTHLQKMSNQVKLSKPAPAN